MGAVKFFVKTDPTPTPGSYLEQIDISTLAPWYHSTLEFKSGSDI